jgi:hypothetical protein
MAAVLTLVPRKPEQPAPRLLAKTEQASEAKDEADYLADFVGFARDLWRTHRELIESDEDPTPRLEARRKEAKDKWYALVLQWPQGSYQEWLRRTTAAAVGLSDDEGRDRPRKGAR